MKISNVAVGMAALICASFVQAQSPSPVLQGESIETSADQSSVECSNCIVTIRPHNPAAAITAKSILVQRDGTTELTGDVKIVLLDGILSAESATISVAADGSQIIRSNQIRFVASTQI